MTARHHYHAYGCSIASEIALPALPTADDDGIDVHIRRGRTPLRLPNERGRGVCYSAAPGEALFWIPGIGRFHVRHGAQITVESSADAATAGLQVFLLHLAFGLLFQQRGDLVLHAAVVESDQARVALAGASSAGKSTIAAALHARGYRVVTDELCVLRNLPTLGRCVMPGPPHLQVWADTLRHLGREAGTLTRVRPELGRYLLPLAPGATPLLKPLTAIYVLTPWSSHEVSVTPLSGARQFEALSQNSYHFEYVPPMGLTGRHFGGVSDLRAVPTALLRFPHDWRALEAVLAQIPLGPPPGRRPEES